MKIFKGKKGFAFLPIFLVIGIAYLIIPLVGGISLLFLDWEKIMIFAGILIGLVIIFKRK